MMVVINYYYLERNILSGPGGDQRYWLCYLSAPIWGRRAMNVTLLHRLVREVSADSREERWLGCFSRRSDSDMSSLVCTFIQNIFTECLWNIVWGIPCIDLRAKSFGYWESKFTSEVSSVWVTVEVPKTWSSPDSALGKRYSSFNVWRLEGREEGGREGRAEGKKEKRKGRRKWPF